MSKYARAVCVGANQRVGNEAATHKEIRGGNSSGNSTREANGLRGGIRGIECDADAQLQAQEDLKRACLDNVIAAAAAGAASQGCFLTAALCD